MRTKRLLAGLGVTAVLAAGGIGAGWLVAPVISGAQTTATTTPATTAPAPGSGQAPVHTPGNCPHMGQNGPGAGGSGAPGGASSEATSLSSRYSGGFVPL